MPATQNATMLADLIDPQVIADYIDEKLTDEIKFAPLATFDNTLVGTAGDTLTFPAYSYIGAATVVAEGTDIPIAKLGATPKTVTVKKLGRAVEFTDEAWLSGYKNNVPEEAAKQVLLAINDGVEKQLLASMAAITAAGSTATIAAATNAADGIADALTKFGEDIDGDKALLIPADFYARLRKTGSWIPNTEIGADALIKGRIGMIHGCQVVVSNRLTDTAYIVKPGALRIVMKRDTLVEFDRDKLAQTNYIIGSKLFAPYVFDERKIIKITLGA